MVELSIGLVFLEYYTAFMFKFSVDALQLPRQWPNFEKDFTGTHTRKMLKIEFADV